MSDAKLARSQASVVAHSPRELLDLSIRVPAIVLKEYMPLEELDEIIARTPQLAPLRELHALTPRLLASPRDQELRDPFMALYYLATCLLRRIHHEIWVRPIERDHDRTRIEAQVREMHPNADLSHFSTPWPPWDPRPQFARHRGSCYNVLAGVVENIGLEAKAAGARQASEGQKVINAVLKCTRKLFGWNPRAGRAAEEEFGAYARVTGDALELMILFGGQIDPGALARNEVTQHLRKQSRNRKRGNPGLTDAAREKKVKAYIDWKASGLTQREYIRERGCFPGMNDKESLAHLDSCQYHWKKAGEETNRSSSPE